MWKVYCEQYYRVCGHIFFGLVLLMAAGSAAHGGDEARLELFSGGDVTANSSFGYTGGVWALGRNINSPGFRLRASGGYGDYAYDGSLPLVGGSIPARFGGDVTLLDLMAGHLWRRGDWTLKAYAGAQYADHDIAPADPANSVSGSRWGAKGQIELWRNLGAKSWFSSDGSYGTAFGDYWAQVKVGRQFHRRLTLGLEAGGLGNEEYDAGRGGAFARLHLNRLDITVSAGVRGDYLGEDRSGYVTLGIYRKH